VLELAIVRPENGICATKFDEADYIGPMTSSVAKRSISVLIVEDHPMTYESVIGIRPLTAIEIPAIEVMTPAGAALFRYFAILG
jgi:hypothetical protein